MYVYWTVILHCHCSRHQVYSNQQDQTSSWGETDNKEDNFKYVFKEDEMWIILNLHAYTLPLKPCENPQSLKFEKGSHETWSLKGRTCPECVSS